MKIHHLATLLWFASLISGQTLVDVRTQTKNVDFSGAASTIPARSGSALPLSCKLGEMFFNTGNAPGQNLYLCAPANTWTVLVSGTSSTTGTVLSATGGQFAFYGTNGSTVSGHTLVAGDIPTLNYQSPLTFTGTGAKTASSTGSVTANDCAKWDTNGNVVDAGAPCGSGSGGGSAFSNLTGGTNTSAVLLIGSGASLAATGSGTIAATSVPASGVTGLANSATTDTTNAGNITSGTLAAARLPATVITTSNASGTGSKYASASTTGASNNCAKWDANGNVVDAGAPCSSGSSAVLQASSHIAEGDSITAGYEAGGVTNTINLAYAYPSLLAASEGSTLADRAISGSQVCDMVTLETNKNSPTIDNNSSIYTMMIGTNDAHVKGTGTYEPIFQNCHKAAIAWDAVGNKYAANSTNCTDTGTWAPHTYQSPSLTGEDTFTVGATKSCSIFTPTGTLYAWYFEQDGNTATFTYTVDGGTPVALAAAQSPSISTQNGGTYGYGLIRIPGLTPNTTHTILFTSTTGTAASNGVGIIAFGTPPAQGTYGAPRVFVGGVPKQQGDAQSAITAQYNADVLTDVNLLAGDGLNVSYVPVRNYLCTTVTSSVCYNAYGVADMNTPAVDSAGFHPNQVGQNDLKQAFADLEQFTPYLTGTGSGTVNSATSGQFAYYSASGTAVSGHTLVASDIPALSYDASGAAAAVLATSLQRSNNLSDLASAATARTNLGLGTAATQASSAFQATLTFTGTGSQTISSTGAGASGDCAKWDANGNVIDAGSPCGSGGSSGAFSSVTAGTNTVALVMGSGGSLSASGTGTIAATSVPASGVTGALAAANLPAPSASSLGGVQSAAAVSHQWINSISTAGAPVLSQPAFADVSGTAADTQLPSDQCTLTKYTVAYTALTGAASATPTSTLLTLPSTSARICFVEISGTTSFAGTGITATTVRLQSGAATPLLYSPNQDVWGTVGPTTNNFWSDAGTTADRTNLIVNAAFTIAGATSSALTTGSVNIVVGTRTVPY